MLAEREAGCKPVSRRAARGQSCMEYLQQADNGRIDITTGAPWALRSQNEWKCESAAGSSSIRMCAKTVWKTTI